MNSAARLCAVAHDELRRHCRWVSRTAIVWRQLALAACALARFLGTPRAAAQMSVPGANHVMIVGTKVAPPFAMKSDDGSWSGISIELWRRIATDLHLSYRFEEVSLDELITGTAGHRLDAAIAAITVTATRAESVDFTQPYYATSLGITVRRVSVFNWLNLAGYYVRISGNRLTDTRLFPRLATLCTWSIIPTPPPNFASPGARWRISILQSAHGCERALSVSSCLDSAAVDCRGSHLRSGDFGRDRDLLVSCLAASRRRRSMSAIILPHYVGTVA